jgi:hypothetical protein
VALGCEKWLGGGGGESFVCWRGSASAERCMPSPWQEKKDGLRHRSSQPYAVVSGYNTYTSDFVSRSPPALISPFLGQTNLE